MYEDDEFARSLRPAQDARRASRVFNSEDSEMMSMIFQYLEGSSVPVTTDTVAKPVGSKEKNWVSPQLGFDPSLVADFQRFAEYNASSQESSPSPTVSLFSQSSGYNVSGASGVTTPRTLSNRSSREPSRTPPDELRMTMKPTQTVAARSTPSPPALPRSQTFESRGTQNEVTSPYRSPSPAAPPVVAPRKYDVKDPQERRQNSYSDAHWPSLATIASKYERKGSRQNSYRNTMPPPMASGARRDELDELQQAYQPSPRQTFSPLVNSATQEKKRSQENARPAYVSTYSPHLDSNIRKQNQRGSQEVSPSPYRSTYSPDNFSARTYESRGSQNALQTSYRNTLPPLAESGARNAQPQYSPNTFQNPNRPQPPPIDPSIRRYESFKMAGASAGRYELKDPQEAFPVDERTKSLDSLVAPRPSVKSRFSFPKPARATITSFVDIMPHAPPSPAATPPGSGTIPLSQLRLPTPDFSLPPRPKKEALPEPLPASLSVGRKDASTSVPTSVLDVKPVRTPSGKSLSRLSAPSLTIQIPESSRPAPQKVDANSRPGLSEALDKIKHESILARPRPQPKRTVAQGNGPVPMWEAPAPVPAQRNIVDASKSVLARPRPKPVSQSNRAAPRTVVEAPFIPSKPTPAPVEAQPIVNASDSTLTRPRPQPRARRTTFDVPASPKGYPLEDAAPMIPAPNFSRTAHVPTFSFQSGPLQEPTAEELSFEAQEPIPPLTLKPQSHNIPTAPTYAAYKDFALSAAEQKQKQQQTAVLQARWFQHGFCAPSHGLQMTMSRRVATFSKLEWAIETSDSSRKIRAFTQTNTLSRRTDFFSGNDGEQGEQEGLFCFQRKTGSTRVGETADGMGLFSVKNSSFGLSPFWVVDPTGAGDREGKAEGNGEGNRGQWVARGDEALVNVRVVCDGVLVGKIECVPRRGKHTYTVDVSPQANYAIMAALVTVFDDWRMDHAC
ncbi:hypothetical protein EG329_013875 [Mollisiaceae sp. DMI_Dod_QoI]|nr:hypothetical protein EG329_013875 [Helotiales sp. DMI_Dod_QoI]